MFRAKYLLYNNYCVTNVYSVIMLNMFEKNIVCTYLPCLISISNICQEDI
jgi:hypothetical protein